MAGAKQGGEAMIRTDKEYRHTKDRLAEEPGMAGVGYAVPS